MRATCLLAVGLMLPGLAVAQRPDTSVAPVELRTSAQSTIELPAAGALLTITFSVQRRTPGAAGRANAERATAIRRAVIALGVPGDSITTRGYSSMMQVGDHGRDTVYVASNTVLLRLSQLGLVSRAIDTVLAEGATQVANLQFWARGVEQARLDALTEGTRRARQQAEAMAKAAGGRVGRLLELSTDAPSRYDARPFGLEELIVTGVMDTPTPIQAPTVRVSVTVYARWEFIPASE